MESELANVGLLLAALEALDIERNKKEYFIKCEISKRGMKFIGHTIAYDVYCICWLGPAIFKDFEFIFPQESIDDKNPTLSEARKFQESLLRPMSRSIKKSGEGATKNAFNVLAEEVTQQPTIQNTDAFDSCRFCISRSAFHDALNSRNGPIIRLKYDAVGQQLVIIEVGNQGRQSSIRFNVSQPDLDPDIQEELLENAINEADDSFIMLPDVLKTTIKYLNEWGDAESKVCIELYPKGEETDVLCILFFKGIQSKSTEWTHKLPYHPAMFKRFDVKQTHKHFYALRSLIALSKALVAASSVRLQFSESGLLLVTIPVSTMVEKAFDLHFCIAPSIKFEED